jgi:hypothetical protein
MGLLSYLFSGYTLIIGSHIRRQLEFLKEKAPPSFKYRQLDDLGCGDGKITLLLNEILLPTRLRGFDINPRLVRKARDKGIEADVKDLEQDMPSGELGVMWGILHHLKDRQGCLRRLKENYSLILIREPIKIGCTRGWELGDPLRKEEIEYLIQEYLHSSQVFYCGNNILIFYASPNGGDHNRMDQGNSSVTEMTDVDLALQEEASHLAHQLFGNNTKKCASFTNRLLDICARAQGKDFLLIHNPGGWGSEGLDHCLQWERSLVAGVNTAIERLGYISLLIQYFRTGKGWREKIQDTKNEGWFFLTGKSSKAKIMATELKFITQHVSNLKVLLIGASQGAAFGNAVMQCLTEADQVYSIELGMPFTQKSRRVITERTLVIDSNGLMADAMVYGNLIGGFKAYVVGPIMWLWYQLRRRPVRFAQCINAPGHDYSWEYPEVRRRVENFLEINFGTKNNVEVGLS